MVYHEELENRIKELENTIDDLNHFFRGYRYQVIMLANDDVCYDHLKYFNTLEEAQSYVEKYSKRKRKRKGFNGFEISELDLKMVYRPGRFWTHDTKGSIERSGDMRGQELEYEELPDSLWK